MPVLSSYAPSSKTLLPEASPPWRRCRSSVSRIAWSLMPDGGNGGGASVEVYSRLAWVSALLRMDRQLSRIEVDATG